METIGLLSPHLFADTYPAYGQMREAAPLIKLRPGRSRVTRRSEGCVAHPGKKRTAFVHTDIILVERERG
jgi:hypothetical protein